MPSDRDPERIAHFRIVGRLGQGGMGIVYRAEDERLRRTVALKVLPEAFAQDPERRARFLREARSAAALTHANIATVHDVGEVADRIYIAMELVEGESLRERLARGPLPATDAVRVTRGIARGLVRAHAKGIVHRDLKPENVMIDAEGEPKILDFGLAKLREQGEPSTRSAIESGETAEQITREGDLLGTPHYMSPEQASGGPIDARTDVFALGVVLYECLAGARPFEAQSVPELLARILRDPPFPLREVAPDVAPPLVALVERCLAKQPAGRFGDAAEVLAALDALPTSRSLTGSVAATVAPREGSRSTLRIVVLLAAAIAAVGGAGLLLRARGGSHTLPAAPSASVASASGVHAITDWPAPKTSSPEAATLYAEGLQAMRDGMPDVTYERLQRALATDPHFAAAHLRMVFLSGDRDEQRAHVAAAVQARGSLSERDQRLLTFEDTVTQSSLGVEERMAAAKSVARDLPDDPEAQFWAGYMLLRWLQYDDAARLYDRALDLDPKFAAVLVGRNLIEIARGDVDAMGAAAQRCLTISPGATACLEQLAEVHSMRGQCHDVEQEARRLAELEPTSARPYMLLFAALEAENAPVEALRQVASKVEALDTQGPMVRKITLFYDVDLDEYVGDFVSAESHLLQMQKEEVSAVYESGHDAEWQLIDVYMEEGALSKAADVGQDYLRRLPALTHDGLINGRINALTAMRDAGRLPDARVRATREDWIRETRAVRMPADVNEPWRWFWASMVETPAQAHEALAALPAFSPLPPMAVNPNGAGDLGKTYALADEADLALPLLREAVASCRLDSNGMTRDTLRNRMALGRALEQKGDSQGACEQYAAVLQRWGDAKPKSATADAARARFKALGCH